MGTRSMCGWMRSCRGEPVRRLMWRRQPRRELRGGGCGAGRARGAERGRAGLWRLLRGDAAEPGMMGKGTAKGAPAGAAALCLPAARWLRPRVCLQPEQPRCKEGKAAGSSRGSRAPGSGCRARGREGSEQLERNKTRKKKKKNHHLEGGWGRE